MKETMSLQELVKALNPIIADIEETRRQIALTKSEKRKTQLMRHIKKQQKKIRALSKENENED